MSKTVTLFSPRSFNLRLDDNKTVLTVVKGTNLNFPADEVEHWYVKANGCKVITTSADAEQQTDESKGPASPAPQAAGSEKPAKGGKGKAQAETVAQAGENAANVQNALTAEGKTEGDVVISGTPWAKKE